jgi:hypothetical protein
MCFGGIFLTESATLPNETCCGVGWRNSGQSSVEIKHERPALRAGRIGCKNLTGRRPSLPHTRACSTIGAERLNFRVRDGNGWDPLAKVTQNFATAAFFKKRWSELV